MMIGAIFFLLENNIPGYFFTITGFVIFFLTGFGSGSYLMYKRAMAHMIRYKQFTSSDTHCGNIGCDVAKRRFKKKFPADYQKMMENKSNRFKGLFVFLQFLERLE